LLKRRPFPSRGGGGGGSDYVTTNVHLTLTERRFRYVKLCGDKAGATFTCAGIFAFIFFKPRRTPETSGFLRVRRIGERNVGY